MNYPVSEHRIYSTAEIEELKAENESLFLRANDVAAENHRLAERVAELEAALRLEEGDNLNSNPGATINGYLDATEIAGRLNIHPESVRRLIRQGKIPAMRAFNKWLVHETNIDDIVNGYSPLPGGVRIPEGFITPSELASMLRVKSGTIHKHICLKHIDAKKFGKFWGISESEASRFKRSYRKFKSHSKYTSPQEQP